MEAARKDRRAALMQFARSCQPNTTRADRVQKCPADILEQLGDKNKHKYFFDLWLQSNRDWGKVVLFEKISKLRSEERGTRRVWLTQKQLEDVYKDATVAAAIIEKKKAEGFKQGASRCA